MTKELKYYAHTLAEVINWPFFFNAWNLQPRFAGVTAVHNCPACRQEWINSFPEEDKAAAKEASKLFDDAIRMINRLDLTHKGFACFGLYPAWSEEEDIIVEDSRGRWSIPFLRQQHIQHAGDPHLCLADFIRPRELYIKDDIASVMGIFCVSFHRSDGQVESFADDYERMLYQTVCDRLAEATAELMHRDVRRIYWGYAPDEQLTHEQIWNDEYQGIRPAVGYPQIPDQSIIFLLDEILNFGRIGIQLTETGMMLPHASACGLLFGHPSTYYFGIGRIGEDQFQDYARRRNLPIPQLRKFLSRNLE